MSQPDLHLAQQFFKENRYGESLAEVQKALAADPSNPTLHAFEGLCRHKLRQYALAEKALGVALQQNPNYDFAWYVWASMEMERGNLKAAEAKIRTATDLNPLPAEYYGLLALCLYHRHAGVAEIRQAARTGLAFDPGNAVCKNVLAMIELRQGRKDLAEKIMDLHLEQDPHNALSLTNQGWNCLHRANSIRARSLFAAALREEPGNPWARSGMRQAQKAALPFYRPVLRFFLLLSSLSSGRRMGVVILAYLLLAVTASLRERFGELAGAAFLLYSGVIYLVWAGEVAANAITAHARAGRAYFSAAERWGHPVALALVALAGAAGTAFIFRPADPLLWFALASFLASIPASLLPLARGPARRKIAAFSLALISVAAFGITGNRLLRDGWARIGAVEALALALLGATAGVSLFLWLRKET